MTRAVRRRLMAACLRRSPPQPLVLDGVAHVDLHAADQPRWQLEDVRGGRAPAGQAPPPAVVEQCGLFLSSRDGDPEIVVTACQAQGVRGGGATQDLGDLRFVQGPGLQGSESRRGLTSGQDFQRAHAAAADLGQQVEGVCGTRAVATGDPFTDVLAVGQQILEVGADLVAAVRCVAWGEGQGQGQRALVPTGSTRGRTAACRERSGPGSRCRRRHRSSRDPGSACASGGPWLTSFACR